MAIRTALLIDELRSAPDALQAALQEAANGIELCLLQPRGRPCSAADIVSWRGLWQFIASGPDLVIADASSYLGLLAAIYRCLCPRSRLLLCTAELNRRHGLVERLVLSRADGILTDGGNMACILAQLQVPLPRTYTLATRVDLEPFQTCPRSRPQPQAHRMIYVGELSPGSGAADFLVCLAAWAEQHPERLVEIWWAGEGDLSGILEAQPLPGNMSQMFIGQRNRSELPEIFAQCGILIVPPMGERDTSPIPEALAAGLVLLDGRHIGIGRHTASDTVVGWSFNPLEPTEMLAAVDHALSTTTSDLDRMREVGRKLVIASALNSFASRIQAAAVAVFPRTDADPGGLSRPIGGAL